MKSRDRKNAEYMKYVLRRIEAANGITRTRFIYVTKLEDLPFCLREGYDSTWHASYWVNENLITIDKEYADKAGVKDLQLVLGHELFHKKNWDETNEAVADAYGLIFALKARFAVTKQDLYVICLKLRPENRWRAEAILKLLPDTEV